MADAPASGRPSATGWVELEELLRLVGGEEQVGVGVNLAESVDDGRVIEREEAGDLVQGPVPAPEDPGGDVARGRDVGVPIALEDARDGHVEERGADAHDAFGVF